MGNKLLSTILFFLTIGLMGFILYIGVEIFNDMSLEDYQKELMQNIEEPIGIIEKKEELTTPQVVSQPIDDVSQSLVSENIDYQSSASKTRYFYNQLDTYSKLIYDGIASNIEKMKNGTYIVEYGDKFSDILSNDDGQNLLGEYYQSAIEAFTYDNPGVFFLEPKKMYLNIQTTTKGKKKTYNVYIAPIQGGNYFAEGFESAEQINQYESQIKQISSMVINNVANSNTEEKIKYIHNFLIDNLEYDITLSQSNIYNLYGALINKVCVCEGYAKAFKYLLDEAGVDNLIVVGIATNSTGETENHAWNYVAIDGIWYAVDVTWDDPIVRGGGIVWPSLKNKYYLKGERAMRENHIPNGQFTEGGKIFIYPELSEDNY